MCIDIWVLFGAINSADESFYDFDCVCFGPICWELRKGSLNLGIRPHASKWCLFAFPDKHRCVVTPCEWVEGKKDPADSKADCIINFRDAQVRAIVLPSGGNFHSDIWCKLCCLIKQDYQNVCVAISSHDISKLMVHFISVKTNLCVCLRMVVWKFNKLMPNDTVMYSKTGTYSSLPRSRWSMCPFYHTERCRLAWVCWWTFMQPSWGRHTSLFSCLWNGDVVVRASDTDILVILLYQTARLTSNLWMEVGTTGKDNRRYLSITKIADAICPGVCGALPAFHVLSGCDYTSAFVRKSKKTQLRVSHEVWWQDPSCSFWTGNKSAPNQHNQSHKMICQQS